MNPTSDFLSVRDDEVEHDLDNTLKMLADHNQTYACQIFQPDLKYHLAPMPHHASRLDTDY